MLTLFGIVFGWPVVAAVSLLVGWWFLPQPAIVKRIGVALGIVKEK
ncbi:MAG: hypothetical protein KIT32_12230 [Rhodocyclaceae bacterium]|nr:hypothetical protein [Rhodocyclaceae bacterium]